MKLTAEQVDAFSRAFLLPQYDNPVPVPTFHREMWELCCRSDKRVAIAAPRSHAKSTAITHAFVLAALCLRAKKYVLIISDTESQASMFLGSLKDELETNEPLREMFGVRKTTRDTLTDIIVECHDGHKFKVTAYGAEQKVRGRKWGNLRPDLIVVDDLENDELVENEDRREKLRNWFFKALIPSLSARGHIRVVGTILHLDSVLMRLMDNKAWVTRLYSAHKSFVEFTELLWPEMWPPERLRQERQSYIDAGFPEGYSQEYLNNPVDLSDAYFRKEDFREISDEMRSLPKNYYAGVDLAISTKDKAAYTVIVVGGVDSSGSLSIVDVRRFRGHADVILDELFSVQRRWNIEHWMIEKVMIAQALEGELYKRMIDNNTILSYTLETPTKDKKSRARSIQGRTRAGGVYFDKTASWYPALEEELLHFPKGRYDDQVDAFAWLGLCIHKLAAGPTQEELEQEQELAIQEQEFELYEINEYTGY